MNDKERKGAVWEITYGIDKCYLTDKEKNYLMQRLKDGEEFIDINESIFTGRFLKIVPNERILEERKASEEYDHDMNRLLGGGWENRL